MRYLVAYDIADDHRRTRVAKTLLDYGSRLQESLFLCDVSEELYQSLLLRVTKELEPLEDRVMVTPVCQQCWSKAKALGLTELPAEPDFYVL